MIVWFVKIPLLVVLGLIVIVPVEGGDSVQWEGAAFKSRSKMPTPRSEIASAVVEGKVYVVGGVSIVGSLSSFECYDPASDRWQRLPNLPCKLNHAGVASHGSTIYVSGGFINLLQSRFSEYLFGYDTKQKKWRRICSLPGKRAKHVMVEKDGWLHLIGGLWNREIWSYNLKSGKWRTDIMPPLPERRDHLSVVLDRNSNFYIVGGRKDRDGEIAGCLKYRRGNSKWEVFTYLPQPRAGQAAAIYNGKIYIAGGESLQDHVTYRRLDIFDLVTGKWTSGEPLKTARHGVASSQVGNHWLVIGGARKAEFKTIVSATRLVETLKL